MYLRTTALASVLLPFMIVPAVEGTGAPDVDAWNRVLESHAREGGLDYAGLAADRADLDAYLRSVAEVDPAPWSTHRKLAFWSNAYNAVVAAFVLERYPGLDSVRKVDGFFDGLTHRVAGRDLTLDEIETAARDLGDARVHFSVVCASTSCPDLRGEAYVEDRLDAQLEEQTLAFLADRDKGLRYEAESDTLHLSSIFKWYAGDFTGGSTVLSFFLRGGILEWVVEHAPTDVADALRDRDPSVRYLEYDWSLNDR